MSSRIGITLRVRLALWSAAVLMVTLTGFSVVVFLTLQHTLVASVENVISGRATRIAHYIPIHPHPPYLTAADIQSTLDVFSSPDVYLEITDARGRMIARSTALVGATLPIRRQSMDTAATGQPDFYQATGPGGPLRLYMTALYVTNPRRLGGFLVVARSLAAVNETLDTLRRDLLVAGVSVLALATGVTFGLARRALRPVSVVTHTAREIALSPDLSRRVPYGGPRDEVGDLALTFNEMLASLESVAAAQKRFVADASHELRAPLTTILGNAQGLLRRPDAPSDERVEALSDIAGETQRLARLVGALLALARADAGKSLTLEAIWLDRIVLDTVGRMAAARPGMTLRIGPIEPVCVRGNADQLAELMVILVDNAIKYSAPTAPVICAVSRDGDAAWLIVEDHGMGIAAGDLPHIFERFYRADRARSRAEAGTGLGLAIAAWIVAQHHGQMKVHSQEGAGSTFTVILPLAEPGAVPSLRL